MKKRSIAIFLATVMISLTACDGSSEADNSSKEPAKEEEQQTSEGKTHLTVWTGYPDNNDWLEWVTAEFEKENADIDVEVTTFPITDFENKIAAAIPAGSCSDVISVNPSFVYAFNSTGKFAQVPEELQELVNSGIYDDAVALESSYQGAVVSVPHMLSNAAWFYNKDYFEEAGLEDVPHSLNEVLEYAQKLAKYDDNGNLVRSGVSLRLTGGASGTTEKWWNMLMQNGGSLIEETGDGKYVAGYNNQAGFDTMCYYLDALYKYHVDNFDVLHDNEAFMAGDTAMFQREANVIVELAKNAPDLNYGTFPMFTANIAITKSWYVLDNGDTAKTDAGWKYVEFVNRPENMIEYHRMTGYQPARKDLDMSELIADVPQREAFFTDFDQVYTYVAIDEFQEIMVKLAARLMDAFTKEEMCGNEEMIWQFLQEASDETNALLKENGHYGGE